MDVALFILVTGIESKAPAHLPDVEGRAGDLSAPVGEMQIPVNKCHIVEYHRIRSHGNASPDADAVLCDVQQALVHGNAPGPVIQSVDISLDLCNRSSDHFVFDRIVRVEIKLRVRNCYTIKASGFPCVLLVIMVIPVSGKIIFFRTGIDIYPVIINKFIAVIDGLGSCSAKPFYDSTKTVNGSLQSFDHHGIGGSLGLVIDLRLLSFEGVLDLKTGNERMPFLINIIILIQGICHESKVHCADLSAQRFGKLPVYSQV